MTTSNLHLEIKRSLYQFYLGKPLYSAEAHALRRILFGFYCGCTDNSESMSLCNCPANTVVFILLTPPWTARRRPRCSRPPLPNRPTQCCARVRALCGMWAKCRAEVMGSSRKVRSRVHARVKETRPWLLFAFFFSLQLGILPTGGCVRSATVLTPQQPRHCTDSVCFSPFIKSSPGRKTTNITTSLGAGEFSTLHPFSTAWEIFCVFGLVKTLVYLYLLKAVPAYLDFLLSLFFFLYSFRVSRSRTQMKYFPISQES